MMNSKLYNPFAGRKSEKINPDNIEEIISEQDPAVEEVLNAYVTTKYTSSIKTNSEIIKALDLPFLHPAQINQLIQKIIILGVDAQTLHDRYAHLS